jgi:tRNA pseudouridine55 synthase
MSNEQREMSNGLLLLKKSPGFTSFESLTIIKKALSTGKVGHTGTLDKFASGLLLVLVGQAGKLASLFSFCEKEYEGRIRFGIQTDTLDPEGKIIREADIPSREQVEAVLPGFRGEILQSPPAYSAIHIDGVRAHELTRQGKTPEMKKRPVFIYKLDLVSWEPPFASVRVCCSAGTYIRSLARDIAEAAGSCAHLDALVRTRIGAFQLSDAFDPGIVTNKPQPESHIEDVSAIKTADTFTIGDIKTSPISDLREAVSGALRPITPDIFTVLDLPHICINEEQKRAVLHGQNLQGNVLGTLVKSLPLAHAAGLFAQVNGKEELISVLEQKDGAWHYGHVFTVVQYSFTSD